MTVWRFNKDRYDSMTDPDKHMDVYTTHEFVHFGRRSSVPSVSYIAERRSFEPVYEASSKLYQRLWNTGVQVWDIVRH